MSQKGFTLIELLLVVALMGISLGVTNDILISLIRSYSKTQIRNEMEQQANFISGKLDKEIRNARSVTVTTGATALSIVDKDGVPISYTLSNDILYRNFNGTTWALSNNASLSGVSISCGHLGSCFVATGGSPQAVTYSFTFIPASQAAGGTAKSFTGNMEISNTLVLRNSY